MVLRTKLLSQKETAKYCNLSISTLKRLRKIDNFPQPVQISERRIGYFINDIEDWINSRPKKKGGGLFVKLKKVRCPQTPLELNKAYSSDLARIKARKEFINAK